MERLLGCLMREERCVVNLIGGGHAEFGARYVCFLRESEIAETPLAQSGMTRTPFGIFAVRKAEDGEFGDGVTHADDGCAGAGGRGDCAVAHRRTA